MPANVDGMVREGISAYRAGRKEDARAMLMRAVEIDQYNEQAWLWLSAVVDSPEEQRTCLENVLTINPNNERAKQGISVLDQRQPSNPKAPPAQAEDVLANSSFTPPPMPASGPFSVGDDDELPSNIGWDAPVTATSSVSSTHKVNEPSEAEYDDWVSKLNLGGTGNMSPAALDEAAKFMSITDDDDDDERFDVNAMSGMEDLFSSGPFSEEAPVNPLPKSETPKPQSPLRTSSPASPPPSPKMPTSSAAFGLLDDDEEEDIRSAALIEDYDDAQMEKLEADEFFQYIPREITATRLPGTNEGYPIPVMLAVVVLGLVNIGAVVFLISSLTST